jgi:TetR/AcrR family transcriptional regulator, regulator of cefoperazone and chloramphenicol sensitivity
MISTASTMDPVATNEQGRGPLARAALIRAGVQVFGENSLASATTREIAQLAGQNISAIAYYFGNKEGLYFAVAHHIGDILLERLGPLLDEIEAQLGQGNHDPETCLHLFGRLIGASLSTHQEMLAVTSIVVKEQMHPTKAFDILYEGCLERLHQVGARLIEAYTGEPPGQQETVLRFHALLGQSLAFRFARETIVRRAGWRDIGPDQVALIERVVTEQVCDALRGLRWRRLGADTR